MRAIAFDKGEKNTPEEKKIRKQNNSELYYAVGI
jgi:hypothetical protein